MSGHLGNSLHGVALGVIITLFVMSVVSIGIMLERWWVFRNAARQSRRYAETLSRLIRQGKLQEAVVASGGEEVKHSHLARVLVAGLQEWQYQREAGKADPETAGLAAKEALRQAASLCVTELRRGLDAVATIGSTAPLVGRLGTTFGIIDAFAGMGITGAGSIGVISTGISEALVTTAFGLFVAIPAVWAYNFFLSRVEGFSVEMDRSGYQLIDHLMKRGA